MTTVKWRRMLFLLGGVAVAGELVMLSYDCTVLWRRGLYGLAVAVVAFMLVLFHARGYRRGDESGR